MYVIKNTKDEMFTFDSLMKESEKRKEISFLNLFKKEEIAKICKHYLALKELAYSMGYEWKNHTSLIICSNVLTIEFCKENKTAWQIKYAIWRSSVSSPDLVDVEIEVYNSENKGEIDFRLHDELNLDLSWAYRSLIEAMCR